MDSLTFQILSHLEKSGVGNFTSLNSILSPVFPVKNKHDSAEVLGQKSRVTTLLGALQSAGYINHYSGNYKFGAGNESEGMKWFDDSELMAAITIQGIDAADRHRKEIADGLVSQSIIDTNNSVKWANEKGVENQRSQTKIGWFSAAIAGLSTLFIIISTCMSYYIFKHSKTDEQLQKIEKSIQDLRTTIQRMPPSQVVIIDSTNHKKK